MRFPLTAHLKVGTNGRAPRPAVSSLLLWLRSRVTHPTPPLRPRTLVASDVNTPEWVKTGSSVTERFEIHEMLMEAQSESFDTLLKYRDSDCDDGRMNVPVPHRSPNDVFC